MKKWMAMMMLGASMAVVAAGCGNAKTPVQESGKPQTAIKTEVEKENAALQKADEIAGKEEILDKVEDANYLEGLNLYSSYDLELQDEHITVELYVAAEIGEDGHAMLDDGQDWALVARRDGEIYPLVERGYIQLGHIGYSVYMDYEQDEMPHIIARVVSGAGIAYYDCSYDQQAKIFNRKTIFEADNINVLYED